MPFIKYRIERALILGALLGFFGACASKEEQFNQPLNSCGPDGTISIEQLATDYRAILIGETHGTNEMPEALIHFLKEVSNDAGETVLALEYDQSWQPALDAFFEATSMDDEDRILGGNSTSDGRTSPAMKQMLRDVKQLKAEGKQISVVAVDYWPTDEQRQSYPYPDWIPSEVDMLKSTRDIAMGVNSVKACELRDCDNLIFYSGSMHARNAISQGATLNVNSGTITRFTTAPAGYVIGERFPAASIFLSHDGGQSSAYRTGGFSTAHSKSTTPEHVTAAYQVYCSTEVQFHDFVFNVGPLSSSK